MIIARVTGTLYASCKNAHLEGKSLLLVREEHPRTGALGAELLAVDRVQAGIGDQVLVNKEGSGARLMFGDEGLPLQAVIVAVVDNVEMSPEETTPEKGN